MKCSRCQQDDTRVIESREVANGNSIRRRRECSECHYRYTTYERIEQHTIMVVKKDGTRQIYDYAKLIAGLRRACGKTTISGKEFEELVARIEKEIYDCGESEITSARIGDIILSILASVNQVAYIRFASVYRNFNDLQSFEQELSRFKAERDREESQTT